MSVGAGLLQKPSEPLAPLVHRDEDAGAEASEDLTLDQYFFEFSSDSFSVESYLKSALSDSGQSLENLKACMTKIDKEIRRLIATKSDGFVEQAASIQKMKADMARIRERVDVLAKEASRIQSSVMKPYQEVRTKAARLRNVQRAWQYFRQVYRLQQFTAKLRSAIGSDDAKAALLLQEALALIAETDLEGLVIVQKDLPRIMEWKRMVQQNAKELLWKGLRSQSQPDVAQGLQVFYNFGTQEFQQLVAQTVETAKENVQHIITQSVDMASLDPDSQQASQSKRTALWGMQTKLAQKLFRSILEVWNLEQVLRRKQDPTSRAHFIDVIHPQRLTLVFWAQVVNIVESEFTIAAETSSFVRQVFVNEYPRLYLGFQELFTRLQSGLGATDGGLFGLPQLQSKHLGMLVEALHPFKREFIERSHSRVHDKVLLMCPSGAGADSALPTISDITTLTTTIQSELTLTEEVPNLQMVLAGGINKSLTLFLEAMDQRISGHGGGNIRRSADIFNITNRLSNNLKVIPQKHVKVAPEVAARLQAVSDRAAKLCRTIIQMPIIEEMSNLKAVVQTGLDADLIFENDPGVEVTVAQELRREFESFEREVLTHFHLSPPKTAALEELLTLVVQDFASNAKSRRPAREEPAMEGIRTQREKFDGGFKQVVDVFRSVQQAHRLNGDAFSCLDLS